MNKLSKPVHVYQVGMEHSNSQGDQIIRIAVSYPNSPENNTIDTYVFSEGTHVDVMSFVNTLRKSLNKEGRE